MSGMMPRRGWFLGFSAVAGIVASTVVVSVSLARLVTGVEFGQYYCSVLAMGFAVLIGWLHYLAFFRCEPVAARAVAVAYMIPSLVYGFVMPCVCLSWWSAGPPPDALLVVVALWLLPTAYGILCMTCYFAWARRLEAWRAANPGAVEERKGPGPLQISIGEMLAVGVVVAAASALASCLIRK